jgi:RNA polymerase sigma-70 factor (ECF subfamily)
MPTQPIPDQADLVRRLKARDPLALAEVFDLYGSLVQSVVLRIVHDIAASEDVVQEVFLAVWTRIAAFDAARGTLLRWICVMARSRAIDYLRSAEFLRLRDTLPLDMLHRSTMPSVQTAPHIEQRDRLRQPWSRLEQHEREVLHMTHWMGMSQQEIADLLNRPLGTVKTWIRRSYQSLREALEAAEAR